MQHIPPVCKVQAKWTEMLTRLAAASAFSASQAAALALWVASARSLRICSSIFSSKSLRKLQPCQSHGLPAPRWLARAMLVKRSCILCAIWHRTSACTGKAYPTMP